MTNNSKRLQHHSYRSKESLLKHYSNKDQETYETAQVVIEHLDAGDLTFGIDECRVIDKREVRMLLSSVQNVMQDWTTTMDQLITKAPKPYGYSEIVHTLIKECKVKFRSKLIEDLKASIANIPVEQGWIKDRLPADGNQCFHDVDCAKYFSCSTKEISKYRKLFTRILRVAEKIDSLIQNGYADAEFITATLLVEDCNYNTYESVNKLLSDKLNALQKAMQSRPDASYNNQAVYASVSEKVVHPQPEVSWTDQVLNFVSCGWLGKS